MASSLLHLVVVCWQHRAVPHAGIAASVNACADQRVSNQAYVPDVLVLWRALADLSAPAHEHVAFACASVSQLQAQICVTSSQSNVLLAIRVALCPSTLVTSPRRLVHEEVEMNQRAFGPCTLPGAADVSISSIAVCDTLTLKEPQGGRWVPDAVLIQPDPDWHRHLGGSASSTSSFHWPSWRIPRPLFPKCPQQLKRRLVIYFVVREVQLMHRPSPSVGADELAHRQDTTLRYAVLVELEACSMHLILRQGLQEHPNCLIAQAVAAEVDLAATSP
eukprot:CAMPEP_0171112006 /NCGR_PEP_ID=MMETSP0766_2-20121228/77587_1 /TAXON_ID=439317 /ORGANISM="Gambierdiscus australes, Strain CAWD 149" /LENGTH=275 /DNA_ID=CAMNT_0011574075 /DNA_START=157 /DNA_END=986 /DNA_ORIENTATION=-